MYKDCDRFVLQPSILKGLGWKLIRLWIMDWVDDPRKVTMILQDAIEAEAAAAKVAYDAEEAEKIQVAPRLEDIVVADVELEDDSDTSIQTVEEVGQNKRIIISDDNNQIPDKKELSDTCSEKADDGNDEQVAQDQPAVDKKIEPEGTPQPPSDSVQEVPTVKRKFSRRGPKEYKLASIKVQGDYNDY